jgi:hypothetical protein
LGARTLDHRSKHNSSFPGAKSIENMAKKMKMRDIFCGCFKDIKSHEE